MSINNLSNSDRKRGLHKARKIRKKRAEIKDSLKNKEIDLNALFNNKEIYSEYIANMKVLDLISALPYCGKIKAIKILKEELNICLRKKVGGLGKNQIERFYNYFNIDKI